MAQVGSTIYDGSIRHQLQAFRNNPSRLMKIEEEHQSRASEISKIIRERIDGYQSRNRCQ